MRVVLLALVACSPSFGDLSVNDPEDAETGGDVGRPGRPGAQDTDDEPVPADVVCYPGSDGSWATCVDVVVPASLPSDYDYPPAYGGDPNYRAPIAFLDLATIDPALAVAPNFRVDELAQARKGRWGVVQPLAVEHLQAVRNRLGALIVNSGYRSPAYNEAVGGASSSRHQYGDAFDLDPTRATLTQLAEACADEGAGYVGVYETHIHCDWRDDPVDSAFMGAEPRSLAPPHHPPAHEALLVRADGVWAAPATGFDEGEPLRRWTALDASGRPLVGWVGRTFVPPPEAASIRCEVGGQVWLEASL